MAVTDVLRPLSVRLTGGGVAVPSGTLAGVTSDNSDSTYVQVTSANSGNNYNLRVESHTPAAGYQRHRIRGHIRVRCDAGTCNEDIDVGRGTSSWIGYTTVPVTTSFVDQYSAWFQQTSYGLDTPGALSDLNIGGGWIADEVGAGETRTAEMYIEIDCRKAPQWSPELRDAAGTNRNEGTVTDTNTPTMYFGAVDYDGLPALNWFANVRTGSAAAPTCSTPAPPVSRRSAWTWRRACRTALTGRSGVCAPPSGALTPTRTSSFTSSPSRTRSPRPRLPWSA